MRSISCVLAAVLFAGAAVAEGKPPGYRVEIAAVGLVFPWSLAFFDEGLHGGGSAR